MKRLPLLLAGPSIAALAGCADLGYGDYSLTKLLDGSPGPVQLAELEQPQGTLTPVDPELIRMLSPNPTVPEPLVISQIDPARPVAPVVRRQGPPNAKPGECYAEVVTPAVTRTNARQVLVSPATTKTETIPAKYRTETVQELVSEATTRTETIPATYKTVIRKVPVETGVTVENADQATTTITEQVLVKPAETRTVEVPAVYETVTERVKVRDSYTEWKEATKVYAIGEEALGGTILANRVSSAKIMCLVEIPAEYQTVTKRVLVSEATTREETIPAQYETVTRDVPVGDASGGSDGQKFEEVEVQVIDRPEEVRVIPVPAVYKTVTKRVLETPAMTRTVPVAAVYRDEGSTEIITPAKREWVSVLCDVNATPDLVMSLQRALEARDLYDGPIDGIIGPQTRRAIKTFQGGKSDVLSLESARSLGLAI